MHRNSLFWGVLLVLFGGLLLLNTLGILTTNVWNLLWPVFLILLGVWILIGVLGGSRWRSAPAEEVTLPLEGARQANVQIHHGAGRLNISTAAPTGVIAQGSFGGGLDTRKSMVDTTMNLDMRPRWENKTMWGFPWSWTERGGLDWNLSLTREIPLTLRLETGAGESHVDLTDACLSSLEVHTGASSSDITLPANAGYTKCRLEAGAASIYLHVPGGVAAQIHSQSGLSSVTVDQTRFPNRGSVYQSPNYDTTANKVDINIEVGVGSVKID